jgi:hypothetical protein
MSRTPLRDRQTEQRETDRQTEQRETNRDKETES